MRRLLFLLLSVFIYVTPAFANGAEMLYMAAAAQFRSIPIAPTVSAVSNSPAQITTTWNQVPWAKSYNLYYKAGSAPSTGTYDGKIVGVTSPYTINGSLTAGTAYFVGVTAVGIGGESALGNVMSVAAAAADTTFHFTAGAEGWNYQWLATGGRSGGCLHGQAESYIDYNDDYQPAGLNFQLLDTLMITPISVGSQLTFWAKTSGVDDPILVLVLDGAHIWNGTSTGTLNNGVYNLITWTATSMRNVDTAKGIQIQPSGDVIEVWIDDVTLP